MRRSDGTRRSWVTVPLILDEKRRKLSKRSEAQTRFLSYIEDGYLPEAMLNFLATMGWSAGEDRKLYSREELIEKFTLEGIVDHPAIFDLAKLNDLQGEYVRMLSVDELADTILPRLQAVGYVSDSPTDDEMAYLRRVTALIRDRLVLLKDAPEMVNFFYTDDFDYDEKGAAKHLAKDTAPAILKAITDKLSGVEKWDVESIETAMRGVAEDLGTGAGHVIHPARMAITGRTWGPGLFELMEVLGRERCLARLNRACQYAG